MERWTVIWIAAVSVFSLFFVVKKRAFVPKDMIIAAILAVLAGLTSPIMGVGVFFAYPASTAILKTYNDKVGLFKQPIRKTVWLSLIIILLVGGVLGAINIFLAMNSQTPAFQLSLFNFLKALNPTIAEEICFRFILYAIAIALLDGKITTKMEGFLCYLLMIVPHVIWHLPDQVAAAGIGMNIVNIIMMSLLFGLPFALLQRKRDLFTAMGSHYLVDIIRFTLLHF